VLPILLFYCRVVVVGCRATYYYLLLLPLSLLLLCHVVLPIFILFSLLLSCHVVLPNIPVYCRVIYCIIFADQQTRTTTILNCVYHKMRDLGGRGAGKKIRSRGKSLTTEASAFYAKGLVGKPIVNAT
jgi:hypothetical protein